MAHLRGLLGLWVVVVGLGCGGGDKPAPAASPASEALPSTSAPKPAPVAAAKASLRCGDFLSAADGTALGLDSSGYDADKTQTNPSLGVVCSMGPVGFSVFHADAYASMIAGLERGVQQGALQAEQGPTLGVASKWSSMGPMQAVMFLSSKKRFAGHVTAADKALAEKLARALDAKMP